MLYRVLCIRNLRPRKAKKGPLGDLGAKLRVVALGVGLRGFGYRGDGFEFGGFGLGTHWLEDWGTSGFGGSGLGFRVPCLWG